MQSSLTQINTKVKTIQSNSKINTIVANWKKSKLKAIEKVKSVAKHSIHKTIIGMLGFNEANDCLIFNTLKEKDNPTTPNDKLLVNRKGKRVINNEEFIITQPIKVSVEHCSGSEIENFLKKEVKEKNCLVSKEILEIIADKVCLMQASATDISGILTGNGVKEVSFFQRNGILNLAGKRESLPKKALKA